jgi:NAD(P)-dependent dehydrogenase (short-subunit alcohol dehydrogenase family)
MSKIACITGADRGLGVELVRVFLKNNYVVFAGRYLKDWNLLDELKEQYAEKLHLIELDISNDASVKNACEYIKSNTEKIDVLINNAAILGDIETTITEEINIDEIQKVFNVNALGPLRVSNGLISLILKGDEKLIVNISSEAGSIGSCYRNSWFAYCMSKAALNMESAIINNRLKELGGNIIVLHPGWMQTFMRGEIDARATMTPGESAEKIFKIAANHEKYKGEVPTYMDVDGEKLKW